MENINKNSAEYKKAVQACREILEGEFGKPVSEESVTQCAGTFVLSEILRKKLEKF